MKLEAKMSIMLKHCAISVLVYQQKECIHFPELFELNSQAEINRKMLEAIAIGYENAKPIESATISYQSKPE